MKSLDVNPIELFGRVVAESGRTVDLPRGEVLFSEGEPARALDLLVRGAVRLWHHREGEEPLVVGVVRAGQLVEPGPFFLGAEHETSASTVTPCTVIRTDRDVIDDLIESQPELRVPLLELLHDATEQSVQVARFLRTVHRIPETSGAACAPSLEGVTHDTSAPDRSK